RLSLLSLLPSLSLSPFSLLTITLSLLSLSLSLASISPPVTMALLIIPAGGCHGNCPAGLPVCVLCVYISLSLSLSIALSLTHTHTHTHTHKHMCTQTT